MQAPAEHQSIHSDSVSSVSSGLIDSSLYSIDQPCQEESSNFHGYYASHMELHTDAQTVARYMDNHREWFRRCAHPMHVEPLGETGYALTIGKFGAFGYEVEPKIGLDLLPQDQGVYRIETLPIPGYQSQGYEVSFQAAMLLIEDDTAAQPEPLTRVEWELNLEVAIHFPRFIHALPKSLVQSTGDRLLNRIVCQVSRRLTHKVQEDFHSSLGITPRKQRKR